MNKTTEKKVPEKKRKYKPEYYEQRKKRKKEICNKDCFHCIYHDCIL